MFITDSNPSSQNYSSIIQSWFKTNLINYLIYNVVDKIFVCKIGLDWETIRSM